MKIKELDTVVVCSDIPEHGLVAGDVGAVVAIYSNDAAEVEFVAASGKTRALVTISPKQLRPIGPDDILTVRQKNAA